MSIDSRVKIIPTGTRFGRLTVLGHAGSRKGKYSSKACWEVRCSCGAVRIVLGWALRVGRCRSCGTCGIVAANIKRGTDRRGTK